MGNFKWFLLCLLFLPLLLFYIPDLITYLLGKEIESRMNVPLESYQAYYERAKEYFEEHKYDECIDSCNSCIRFDNKHAEPYVLKTLAYYRKKEYSEALKAINSAMQIERKQEYIQLENKILYKQKVNAYVKNVIPKQKTQAKSLTGIRAILNNARNNVRVGNYAKAINDYTNLIENHSRYIEYSYIAMGDLYYERGLAYLANGNIELAKQDLHKAYRSSPNKSKYKKEYDALLNKSKAPNITILMKDWKKRLKKLLIKSLNFNRFQRNIKGIKS